MKIRSLLLGSVAAAGLATTGYAADLGVVTSLDVCDELGLSGLTISSDDNCLQISGGVSFAYSYGNYEDVTYVTTNLGSSNTINNHGGENSSADVDAWLKFVATASTDFGPASATIKLIANNMAGNGTDLNVIAPNTVPTNANPLVQVSEAWVGIGDTTVLMAGWKSSIFNSGDDVPLNYLGLFNSDIANVGVAALSGPATGGDVIQVTSNLGNGIKLSAGAENLGGDATFVGVVAYAGDGVTGHVSAAVDDTSWMVHAGFQGTWDPVTVVGAFAADATYYDALGSISAKFDMFTLAVSGESASDGMGAGASLSAKVNDTVTVNLGSRYWTGTTDTVWQTEAAVTAAVTETITATGAVGYMDSTAASGDYAYAKGSLAWAPGGGFTASVAGEANTLGAYKATFKAAKTIK